MLMETLRIIYTKQGYMRFLSHLELMKLFERVFRFQNLPLRFSEGFNPHPKMNFASPLSVGYSSQYEIMEVQLKENCEMNYVKQMKFPDGIKIVDAKYVDTKASLMGNIAFSEYIIKIEFKDSIPESGCIEKLENFMNQDEINYEKKTKKGTMKTVNARELIKSLSLIFNDDKEIILKGTMASSSNGSLSPELLGKLFAIYIGHDHKLDVVHVERLKMFMNKNEQLIDLYEL